MTEQDFPHPAQVRAALDYYETVFRGRTCYSGQEPRHDEVLVAELKRHIQIRKEVIAALRGPVYEDKPIDLANRIVAAKMALMLEDDND